MKRIAIAAMYIALTTTSFAAESPHDLLKIFDAACVSTGAEREKIQAAVRLFERPPEWRSMLATPDIQSEFKTLTAGSAASELWAIAKAVVATNTLDALYFVFYNEKKPGGFASDNCGVGARYVAPSAIKREIERLYKVRKLTEERQGFSVITAYSVDMVGLSGKYAIAVQEDADERRPSEMVTVTIFQF